MHTYTLSLRKVVFIPSVFCPTFPFLWPFWILTFKTQCFCKRSAFFTLRPKNLEPRVGCFLTNRDKHLGLAMSLGARSVTANCSSVIFTSDVFIFVISSRFGPWAPAENPEHFLRSQEMENTWQKIPSMEGKNKTNKQEAQKSKLSP